jgi:GNAT superfamily N-acetyltransferase
VRALVKAQPGSGDPSAPIRPIAEGSPWRHETPQIEIRTMLRDGTPVLIRPVRASDVPLVREAFEHQYEESVLRRFLVPLRSPSDRQLERLVDVDFWNHIAWGAVREDRPDEGLGIARCVRMQESSPVAEVAVTVIDAYQRRGLGSMLFALLVASAQSLGITTLQGYVLSENAPVLRLVERLGGVATRESADVLRVEIPLDPTRAADDEAMRALRSDTSVLKRFRS